MICPWCGAEVPETKFCSNCGAPLAGVQGGAVDGYPPQDDVLQPDSPVAGGPTWQPSSDGFAQPSTDPGVAATQPQREQAQVAGGYTAPDAQAAASGGAEYSSAPHSAASPYGQTTSYSAPTGQPFTANYGTQSANVAPKGAFVLVIVGLVMSLLGFLALPGLVCSIVGLVLNARYNRQGMNNAHKTSTVVVGIIGLIVGLLVMLTLAMGLVLFGEVENQFEENGYSITDFIDEETGEVDSDRLEEFLDLYAVDEGEGENADEDATARGGVLASSSASSASAASSSDSAAKSFVGKWRLASMVQHGEETGASTLDLLADYDLELSLQLEKDGNATFVLFGTPVKGTWEALSSNGAIMRIDGDSVPLQLENGRLSMTSNDETLVFKKSE